MEITKKTHTLAVMGSINELTKKKIFWKIILVAYAAIIAILAYDIFLIKVPVDISLPATLMLIGLAVYVLYILTCLIADAKNVPLKFCILYGEEKLTDLMYRIEVTRTLLFIGDVTATYEFRPTGLKTKNKNGKFTYYFTGPMVVRIKYPRRPEVVNKRSSVFKVKASREALKILEEFICSDFYCDNNLKRFTDSMLFDSGTTIASGTFFKDGESVTLKIMVDGYVTLNYKGKTYNKPSDFPKELVYVIRENPDNWMAAIPEEDILRVAAYNRFAIGVETPTNWKPIKVIDSVSDLSSETIMDLLKDEALFYLTMKNYI